MQLQPLSPDQGMDGLARHVLHRNVVNEVPVHLRGIDVVDGNDIWMVQRRGCLGLLHKALPALGIGQQRMWRQNLDRHCAVEVLIDRAEDKSHAAFAQLGRDLVVPESLADHLLLSVLGDTVYLMCLVVVDATEELAHEDSSGTMARIAR